ncbi:MAG TPA: type II toxin-antitoxin system VapC family toxin [Terracidiphilus sp.]|jgi:predicted nucleic acid-binding protein|nr:type II toxin-antitoxin system VapC family toxin [Terracidiphilus sp.]
MRFVLDASVTITWVMRDEEHPLADLAFHQLQSGSAIVPGIWWYEIRNILVLNERRGRIAPEDSAQFLRDLQQLSIEIDFPLDDTRALSLAREHTLTVYDSAYLALAMREQLPLATLDKVLASAARSAGVPLLA